MSKPKVPDTIGHYRALRLARAAARQNTFSKKAVDRRKASERQRRQAGSN